jgi:hypothetical protein
MAIEEPTGWAPRPSIHLSLPTFDYGLLAAELQVVADPELDCVQFTVEMPAEEIQFSDEPRHDGRSDPPPGRRGRSIGRAMSARTSMGEAVVGSRLDRLYEGQQLILALTTRGHTNKSIGAAIGYHHSTIADWRVGKRAPSAEQLERLRALATR